MEDCLYHQLLRVGSTERSAFAEKNYSLIGAAQKLMTIVKQNYPNLYSQVQFKAADAMYGLMYKVVYSGERAENQEHYATLNELLIKELKRIKNTEKIFDQDRFAYLELVTQNERETKRKLKKRARKDRLKQQIKQLALRLKGY